MFFSELYMANNAWKPHTKLRIRTRNGLVKLTALKCHTYYGDLRVDAFDGKVVWISEFVMIEEEGGHDVDE